MGPIHNSAIIAPLVNKPRGILCSRYKLRTVPLMNWPGQSLAPCLRHFSSLIGRQWDPEIVSYLLLAGWKWSKLCLKINHQQSSVTFTGLRCWEHRGGGLAGATQTCFVDEYLIWTHLKTYSQFWFCFTAHSDGDYSEIHSWCDLTQTRLRITKYVFSLSSSSPSAPLAWLLIYSAESEWSLIWIFLSRFQQIFSHDTKIFRIINALLHLSMVYEGCKCRFISLHYVSIVW